MAFLRGPSRVLQWALMCAVLIGYGVRGQLCTPSGAVYTDDRYDMITENCTVCTYGSHYDAASGVCQQCAIGQYDHDHDVGTPCVACLDTSATGSSVLLWEACRTACSPGSEFSPSELGSLYEVAGATYQWISPWIDEVTPVEGAEEITEWWTAVNGWDTCPSGDNARRMRYYIRW